MILSDGERLDDLEYKRLKIIQREGLYHFTSDSVLLANLVKVYKGAKVLDLGTGSGIIAILIAAKTEAASVTGIEIQEEMADMASRSVEYNGLSDRVKILKLDIKDAASYFGGESFDIVVVNPPYGRLNSGDTADSLNIRISKTELKITLQEIILNAAKLLRFGGRFYIVHKAERLAETVSLMDRHNLTVKKITNIQPKAGKSVDTVIIEGKKGAKQGMKAEILVVYNQDNSYTREAAKLYAKEK